jgi:hypothetical protein
LIIWFAGMSIAIPLGNAHVSCFSFAKTMGMSVPVARPVNGLQLIGSSCSASVVM